MDLCPYGSICIHYIHTVCVAVQPLCSITLVNPIDAHCRSDRFLLGSGPTVGSILSISCVAGTDVSRNSMR